MESNTVENVSALGTAEDFLAAIVESSDDAIVGKDLNGIIVSWNPAAERIFGYSASEAIGKSISLIIPDDRLEDMRNILGAVSQGRRVEHQETKRRRKDGEIIDVSLTVSPIRNEDGEIVGASKIARDITQVKQAQRVLDRNVLLLRTLYESGRTLGFTLDPALVYSSMRELVCRVLPCDALIVSSFSAADQMIRAKFAWIEGQESDVSNLPAIPLAPEGHGLQSAVIRSGESLLVTDVASAIGQSKTNYRLDPDGTAHDEPDASKPQTRAMMLVPIRLESEVVGVVQLMSNTEGAYDQETLELLEGLVFQMAAAMRNAELYQRTMQNAAAFELLANAMPQIAWALDAQGHMDFLNNVYAQYTGKGNTLSPNSAWDEVVHPEDRKLASERYASCIADGRIWEQELRLRDREGRYRWHLSRLAPVEDAEGNIVRWFGTSTDIHDRKVAEAQAQLERAALRESREELRKLNEELEQRVEERTAALQSANEEMEGFTYSVSHDLRAPLRAIMSSSMMLMEDFGPYLPEEAKGHLRRQAAAAKKLAALIDDLLQYSRLGRKTVDRQTVSVTSLAQAMADELSRRHPERSVTWKIQPSLEVQGDPNLIAMLLQNLLDNAFKFTGECQQAIIELGYEDRGFFVRDNGVGFDMQYAGKLFRPFERLHRDVDYEGTGIGLANVKRIVERHGGKVWAEGELGKGATFWFRF